MSVPHLIVSALMVALCSVCMGVIATRRIDSCSYWKLWATLQLLTAIPCAAYFAAIGLSS